MILVPKNSLQNLDPTWSSSSCIIVDVGNGYDPPRPMVTVNALGDPRSTNLDPGSPSSIPAPAQSPQPPQTGLETCRSCNVLGLHASATTIAPNQEITSVPPEFSKQVPTFDTAITSEASEIVHVSVTSLDGSSPPKSQESEAPKAAQSHKTQIVLADPPPPGLATHKHGS